MEGYQTAPQAGPKVLGAKAPLAAGAWTSIVSIIAPAEAAPGQLVNVEVRVKNIGDYGFYIAVTAQYDGVDISMSPDYAGVDPGATYSFYGSFTMPSYAVTISVWSFFWDGTSWIQDDSATKNVAVAEVYKGTISRMELEHDGTYDNIPAYDLPQNERGLVHITGRNDTAKTQRMGIDWTVKNPQGAIVEHYSAWEAWPYTGAGDEHEFIGGRFTLDKTGTWKISVDLLMNPSAPQIVDSYSGTLCTVKVVVGPPEFGGFGIKDYNKV